MMQIFIILIIAIATISCSGDKHFLKTKLTGSQLPNFSYSIGDSVFLINKDNNSNKKVLVFYFSPTCPYSRAMVKDIIENAKEFSRVQIYMLSTADEETTRTFTAEFALEKSSFIKVGLDYNGSVGKYYSIKWVPYLAIYNQSKKLVAEIPGRVLLKDLETFITY